MLQHLSAAILQDRGEEDMIGAEGVEQHVREVVRTSAAFWKKGSKCSLSRFLDVLRKSRSEDALWHSRLYGMLVALMLLGKLDGTTEKEFGSVVKRAMEATAVHAQPQGGEAPRQAIRAGDAAYKSVRESACNHLHLAALMWCDEENQRRQRIILTAFQPVELWHSACNTACRHVDDGRAWLLDQMTGGILRHIRDLVARLAGPTHMQYLGFNSAVLRASAGKGTMN